MDISRFVSRTEKNNCTTSEAYELPDCRVRQCEGFCSFYSCCNQFRSVFYLLGDGCELGRWIFMVKMPLFSSSWGSFLQTFDCCMVKLDYIYRTGFLSPYFEKSFLRSGLETLAGLPWQDASKSIAITQIMFNSLGTSLEDHQEVEEFTKDCMTKERELEYSSLEKAMLARGLFATNCSCGRLLDKLPENLLVDIFCPSEEKAPIGFKCLFQSLNKLICDVCDPKISAFIPFHVFIYMARRVDWEEFIDFLPNRVPASMAIARDSVESLFALLPFDCFKGLFLFEGDAFEDYYVCNPMTRQCWVINGNIRRQKTTYDGLPFNPSDSTHHKVCSFKQLGGGRTRNFSSEVFSSEMENWMYYEIISKLYKQGDFWVKDCVYLGNHGGLIVPYRLTVSKVFCFILNEIKAHAVDIHEEGCDHWGFVGRSKGILYCSNHNGSRFYLWMLEEHYNGNPWILIINVSIDSVDISFPGRMHPTSEVIFLRIPDLIDLSVFKKAENLKDHIMRHLPLGEVANSLEVLMRGLSQHQLVTKEENDDMEFYDTVESCAPKKIHSVEEHDADPASSDRDLVMEGFRFCDILYKLSPDLLAEILCRLPDKSIGRLKCVCKSWDDVITNVCLPKIAASRLCGFIYRATIFLRLVTPRLCLRYASHAKPPAPTMNLGLESFHSLLPFDATPQRLLDCCNGLFLFRYSGRLLFVVCNPMTRERELIDTCLSRERWGYAALAFDPCRSLHYRIVCFNHAPPSLLTLEIFSSETGEWTGHEVAVDRCVYGHEWIRRCVYLKGALYRLSRSKHVMRVDLDSVDVRIIKLPGNGTTENLGNISASGGRLYYGIHDGCRLFVWMLEEHWKGDSWVLVHNVCISDLAKNAMNGKLGKHMLRSTFRVYGMHPVCGAIFLGTTGSLFRYDFDDQNFEVIYRNNGAEPQIRDAYSVYPYTCCMLNLKNSKGHGA